MSETAVGGQDVLAVCNMRASAEELHRSVTPMADGVAKGPVELGGLLYDYVDETGQLPSSVELRRLALDAVAERDADTVYGFLSGNLRPDDRQLPSRG